MEGKEEGKIFKILLDAFIYSLLEDLLITKLLVHQKISSIS